MWVFSPVFNTAIFWIHSHRGIKSVGIDVEMDAISGTNYRSGCAKGCLLEYHLFRSCEGRVYFMSTTHHVRIAHCTAWMAKHVLIFLAQDLMPVHLRFTDILYRKILSSLPSSAAETIHF